MVAKVRERLAVSKQAARKVDVKRFNLRKLNELEVGKKYTVTTLVVTRLSIYVVISENCICTE